MEHHRVQLHGAPVEVFLWDRTELHRRAWAGEGRGERGVGGETSDQMETPRKKCQKKLKVKMKVKLKLLPRL